MKNIDHRWTRLASALLQSRDAWRALLRRPDLSPDVRAIAEQNAAAAAWALKKPEPHQAGSSHEGGKAQQ